MFGLGKIFNAIKFIAPILQFIPMTAPFATMFRFAEQISNLVSTFKNGFSFLDLVSKFAPLPKLFSQGGLGCFNFLDSSKINIWQNLTGGSDKLSKMFNVVNELTNSAYQINTARTTAQFFTNI